MATKQHSYYRGEVLCDHDGWTVRYLPGFREPLSPYAVCSPDGDILARYEGQTMACAKARRMAFQSTRGG